METAAKNLAELGVEMGHQVSCVVSSEGAKTTQHESVGDVHVIRHPQPLKILSAPVSPKLFWHSIKKNSVVHVHLPHPFAELTVLRLLIFQRNSKMRLIPFFHAMPLRQGWLGKIWFEQVTSRILDKSEAILVSNDRIIRSFPALERWKEKIRIVPFHVDQWNEERFDLFSSQRRTSTEVFALGRLVAYKGFDVLIRAWGSASRRCQEVRALHLNIAGEGPEHARLQSIISDEGLDKSVSLVGHCTNAEKEKWFEKAFLFAAPSVDESETFGISILEAQAQGLPVITTRLETGVSLLARKGACGAVVTPGSVEELSQAIETLALSKREVLESIGRESLRFVQTHYSKKHCQTEYEAILKGADSER